MRERASEYVWVSEESVCVCVCGWVCMWLDGVVGPALGGVVAESYGLHMPFFLTAGEWVVVVGWMGEGGERAREGVCGCEWAGGRLCVCVCVYVCVWLGSGSGPQGDMPFFLTAGE